VNTQQDTSKFKNLNIKYRQLLQPHKYFIEHLIGITERPNQKHGEKLENLPYNRRLLFWLPPTRSTIRHGKSKTSWHTVREPKTWLEWVKWRRNRALQRGRRNPSGCCYRTRKTDFTRAEGLEAGTVANTGCQKKILSERIHSGCCVARTGL
jgi:hypothetical protein